jgi:hypothetical protein
LIRARLQPQIGADRLNHAISHGKDELTKPNDNFEIIRIGFRILFRVSRRTRDRKYNCPELVYDCFEQVGVPFSLPDEYVSPDDTWSDDQVQGAETYWEPGLTGVTDAAIHCGTADELVTETGCASTGIGNLNKSAALDAIPRERRHFATAALRLLQLGYNLMNDCLV